MDVTFTLVFFCSSLSCGGSFAAVYFTECTTDARSPLSMHFHFLLLIVGEGGNSREIRPAHRSAHVRGPLFPEPFRRALALNVQLRNSLRVWERWLSSHRAPEGSRKRGKRIARPSVLDP